MESPWFRHPRVWLVIGVVGLSVTLWSWFDNREPPTVFRTQISIPTAAPGETVRIEMFVQRDVRRECSVGTSRSLIDSNHASTLVVPYEFASAEGRKRREEENPGRLALNLRVPPETPNGMIKLLSENKYVCIWNPTTWILPIDDSWTAYINVQGVKK